MKPIFRIALASLLVTCMALFMLPRPASAHPMGNFTINQYSAITVGSDKVEIFYVVDMAEIPTFTELGAIRADHSTDLTQAQRDKYLATKSAELAKGLSLSMDGRPLQLAVDKTALSFPPGAGGLPTMRLEINLSAATGAQRGALQYTDVNYKERIGWKEIIANPVQGAALQNSSVPTTDRSDALRKYNPDFLQTPPTVTAATLSFAPGSAAATASNKKVEGATNNVSALSWAQGRADALTELIAQPELPLGAFLIALLIAFGFGAGHALSPGHGKTVVAAYLVGSRGTAKHAALLGVTVTVSHTIGVFLLGLVVLYAANYILPEQLYPWLGFTSGLLVAIMGVALFIQRRRSWRRNGLQSAHKSLPSEVAATVMRTFLPAQRRLAWQRADAQASYSDVKGTHDAAVVAHVHDGVEHSHSDATDHSHDHSHDHDHDHSDAHAHDHAHEHTHEHDPSVPHKHGMFSRPHTHLPADGQQVKLSNLLALGISGGIIPCPSALVVLLVAVASHRVALGLALILAFSFGLAAVLTGIGLLMVYSRNLMSRFNFGGGLLGRMPMLSAVVVTGLGLLIAFEALKSGGVLR